MKYELKKYTAEVLRKAINPGCIHDLELREMDPITLESFDDKSKALESLKGYNTEIYHIKGDKFEVTEYWVEEAIYDEDGEWIGGGDICDYSSINITIYKDRTMDILGIVHSIQDADKIVETFEKRDIECYVSYKYDYDAIGVIRKRTGMSQSEFARYFGIPLRTIQSWESRMNEPEYVSNLIQRVWSLEKKERMCDNE